MTKTDSPKDVGLAGASGSVNPSIAFLAEASTYFRNRPTNGEDKAHWANVYNAENCDRAGVLIATTVLVLQLIEVDLTAGAMPAKTRVKLALDRCRAALRKAGA